MIAARDRGLVVVTGNPGDFSRVPGLALVRTGRTRGAGTDHSPRRAWSTPPEDGGPPRRRSVAWA